MQTLRVFIVDDEPLIREGLRQGLTKLDAVQIAGEFASGAETIDAILSRPPDLVLLDIHLPDCTGLDVVRQIGPARMPMVVFVTAYDEYALKAFELNAVDYLLKPFDEERLARSIDRARSRIALNQQSLLSAHLRELLKAQEHFGPQRLVVRNGERYDFVPLDSIDWIESADNYVKLHCGPKSMLLHETLTSLESKLDPRRFARIHRCHIINISRLVAVHPILNGTYELELRSGIRLSSGRQFKDTVHSLLRT
jgi:two-component system, LytTR family, response regulator